jgi:hypothetical protein
MYAYDSSSVEVGILLSGIFENNLLRAYVGISGRKLRGLKY